MYDMFYQNMVKEMDLEQFVESLFVGCRPTYMRVYMKSTLEICSLFDFQNSNYIRSAVL